MLLLCSPCKGTESPLQIASRNTWKLPMCSQLFLHWWHYISEDAINCDRGAHSSLWNLSPLHISTFKDNNNSSPRASIPLCGLTATYLLPFPVKFSGLIISRLEAVVWGQFSIQQLSNSCQIKTPVPKINFYRTPFPISVVLDWRVLKTYPLCFHPFPPVFHFIPPDPLDIILLMSLLFSKHTF